MVKSLQKATRCTRSVSNRAVLPYQSQLPMSFAIATVFQEFTFSVNCTTIHRYPIFSTRYSVMCKVNTGYCGTSEIEHGLVCAPVRLIIPSLKLGDYFSVQAHKPCSICHKLSFYIYIWSRSLSSISYEQKKISLVLRLNQFSYVKF